MADNQKETTDIEKKRHSAAHLLAMAILDLFPDAKLGIGPTIENGFYYDFELLRGLTSNDLPKLEKKMKDLIKQDLGFQQDEISVAEAAKLFKGQPFKEELVQELADEEEITLSTYKTGNFIDLCKGGHVQSTKEINPEGLKLIKTAGAYWRGDENRPMLQRIYGVLFDTKKELDSYITVLEEAEKRDHKKLGKELDLFVFSDLVGGGLPLWTPKGTIVRNLLDDYVWQLRSPMGYEKVTIPHITKKDLYVKSGHWVKFANELFRIKTREGHEFAMKPMNCPHHAQIYAARPRSYRDLPQRYGETTMCYRDEQTGELQGLSRVRAFTQDDAHVFCRQNQVKDEVNAIWDIVNTFHSTFGFNLQVRLSRYDPDKMKEYLGSETEWLQAEKQLKELVTKRGTKYIDGFGEAAFYGPKLDFLAKDTLGREWQLSTIQLDFNQPEGFDLHYINERGEKERVVMIHAAIMGSIERFLSILIEHYAGAFPTWLSPVQVHIVPVSDKYNHFATEHILNPLQTAGIRAELNDDNESVGKKIRFATTQKLPYMVVVGEKEIESSTLAVRSRDKGDLGTLSMGDFLKRITEEINKKK